jgi:hypothetical protein
MNRKTFNLFILFSIFIFIFPASLPAQEKLYIFYPTIARPNTIQDKMQSIFKGVTVTVFGRYIDFSEKIGTDPPNAILTKTALIKQLNKFDVVLKGCRKGATNETYVLLSIDTLLDKNSLRPEMVIGCIDILGRDGMNSFAAQFFPSLPKLKRVTKLEDLLSMLSFNMASAILVEDYFVEYFKKTSNQAFSTVTLPCENIGIIALAVKNGEKAEKTITVLKNADKSIISFFTIDSWK